MALALTTATRNCRYADSRRSATAALPGPAPLVATHGSVAPSANIIPLDHRCPRILVNTILGGRNRNRRRKHADEDAARDSSLLGSQVVLRSSFTSNPSMHVPSFWTSNHPCSNLCTICGSAVQDPLRPDRCFCPVRQFMYVFPGANPPFSLLLVRVPVLAFATSIL